MPTKTPAPISIIPMRPAVSGKNPLLKLAIINHKGGVGKTSTAVHLSGTFASMGYRVLVCDCDSQGDLSAVFVKGHEHLPHSIADIFDGNPVPIAELIQPTNRENVFVITADDRLDDVDKTHSFQKDPAVQCLADALSDVEHQYDVILFDCPPRRHLTSFAALVAASEVIIPCEPERFSVRSMARLRTEIDEVQQQLNPQLRIKGYFLSKLSSRATSHQKYREMLIKALGDSLVFKTSIPDQAVFKTAINVGKPVCDHAPKSKAAKVMKDFALELLGDVPHEYHAIA